MPTRPGPLAALLLACAAGACAPAADRPTGTDPHAVQVGQPGEASCLATAAAHNAQAAAATNGARARAGLPPVRPDPQLARVAARHSCDMAQRGRMTHLGSTTTGPMMRLRQAGYAPTISAENIAAGPYSLPRVLNEWATSPGHLDNILLPQVRDFGVGRAVAADGRTVYWTAVYAAPRP